MPVVVMLFTKKDCPNCPQAKKVLSDLEGEFSDRIRIDKYDLDKEEDLLTALQNQVMSTPSVVVGGTLLASGRPISKEEVIEAVEFAEKA